LRSAKGRAGTRHAASAFRTVNRLSAAVSGGGAQAAHPRCSAGLSRPAQEAGLGCLSCLDNVILGKTKTLAGLVTTRPTCIPSLFPYHSRFAPCACYPVSLLPSRPAMHCLHCSRPRMRCTAFTAHVRECVVLPSLLTAASALGAAGPRPHPRLRRRAALERDAALLPGRVLPGTPSLAPPGGAGNRRFWLLSALRAHTTAP
jgi:hypothetical protein